MRWISHTPLHSGVSAHSCRCCAACSLLSASAAVPAMSMEKSLSSLLAPLFPSLDGELIAYLAGVACEGNAAAKWRSAKDAWACLGELLDSYEAVSNDKEGMAKCDQLIRNMQEKGIIKGATPAAAVTAKPAAAATATPAAAPATAASSASASKPAATAAASASAPSAAPTAAAPAALPVVGSTCLARFSGDGTCSKHAQRRSSHGDWTAKCIATVARCSPRMCTCDRCDRCSTVGLFYRARVIGVKSVPVVRILVKFVEYGDQEEVALSATKDMVAPKAGASAAAEEKKGPKKTKQELEDEEDEDEEDDDEEEEDEDALTKPAKPVSAKLLGNPVQIGEIGPSRAAARAAEAAAAALAEANQPGKELTSRDIKMLRKRQLKLDRLAREAQARATWFGDGHKQAVASTALPLYLQSQHLAKKAGTKDIALEDLSLLAPDNAELLCNTELKIVFGRRYGLIGRNGIGSTCCFALNTLRTHPTSN